MPFRFGVTLWSHTKAGGTETKRSIAFEIYLEYADMQ